MTKSLLDRYLTVFVAAVLAATGILTYLGRLDSQLILGIVAIAAVGVASFYLGQWSVDIELRHREQS